MFKEVSINTSNESSSLVPLISSSPPLQKVNAAAGAFDFIIMYSNFVTNYYKNKNRITFYVSNHTFSMIEDELIFAKKKFGTRGELCHAMP